ncbi:hypothetical protein, partial [Ruminococcus bicirculans (ex Wegman et al. 2014)]|uniref:hypothetical protein n=1 Tax=Ruminococcus bicirculans (ex Wegman et al. 2014) TaxID=1160721 RepID=UPI0039A01781
LHATARNFDTPSYWTLTKEKTERLNALNIELNLNEKDTSVMDTEPEQAEEQPERKCASRER